MSHLNPTDPITGLKKSDADLSPEEREHIRVQKEHVIGQRNPDEQSRLIAGAAAKTQQEK